MDASSSRHTLRRTRPGADVVAESQAALRTNITRRVSPKRVAAGIWRAVVEASAYETEEGVVIARGWCFPWLCFPITPRSHNGGGRRTWNRGGSS
jgi:hypothetical protein